MFLRTLGCAVTPYNLEIQVDITTSTLYAAATESLVSETSATSTFEKMIQVAFTHSTGDTFFKELRETEKQIKKDFEISSMPGPWRSAKSVIQSAMKTGVTLVDDNGGFYGKTYLQNKIKETKASKDPVSVESYTKRIIDLLINTPASVSQKDVYMNVINYLEGVI
jgi:hypothetical protein